MEIIGERDRAFGWQWQAGNRTLTVLIWTSHATGLAAAANELVAAAHTHTHTHTHTVCLSNKCIFLPSF